MPPDHLTETDYALHAADPPRRSGPRGRAEAGAVGRLCRVQRGAQQGRNRHGLGGAAATQHGRDDGAPTERQDGRLGWPLRRDQGAIRRLLLRHRLRHRRGDRMGETLPLEQVWLDRDPSRHGSPGQPLVPGSVAAATAAERVARESYGRLVALLAARTRDLAGAEDALGEAFAAALRTWPRDGVPDNPAAWLLTAARRRQTDAIRREIRAAEETSMRHIADEI